MATRRTLVKQKVHAASQSARSMRVQQKTKLLDKVEDGLCAAEETRTFCEQFT